MARIVFCADKSLCQKRDENAVIIHWQGRNSASGVLNLEEELDKRLADIRSEHMRWAYETGFLFLKKGDTLSARLECGAQPSMWWTSLIYERHPRLSPNLFTIYKLRCLELILIERECKNLVVYGGTADLRSVMEKMCFSHGWTIEFADKAARANKNSDWKKRVYLLFPAMFRAIVRFFHWYWKIRRKLPFAGMDGSEWQKSVEKAGKSGMESATIVTYFPNIDQEEALKGRFRSRYWESLHQLLNSQAKMERPEGPHFVRWLFIRFPAPDFTFEQCIGFRNAFQQKGRDGLSFNYLEEFVSSSGIYRSLWRWLKVSWQSFLVCGEFVKNCHFANSSVNFWPYMKDEWAESFRGWRCLERCLQNEAFHQYFSMSGRQRWNLFPLENCPWERMLTSAARTAFVDQPVYGSQHSIVRATDFRYFDDPRTFEEAVCKNFQPDIIGANGDCALNQLSTNGMPARYLRQLEALRYLYLAKYKKRLVNVSDMPPQAGEPLAYSGPKMLLLVTSFFEDETSAHLKLLGEALDANILDDWHIVIKPHPYLPVDSWLSARPSAQAANIRLAYGPLEQTFMPGTLVWASNSTTAVLDAILRGLSVMVMRPSGDFDLCPVQDVPGLARTGNLDELAAGLVNAAPLKLQSDYLDLNTDLPAWRKLLGCDYEK